MKKYLHNNYSKLIPFGIVLLTFIVFLPTLFNDFQTGWDDTWQVLENPFVLDYSWQNTIYHFKNFFHGQYSPVNTLSYILVYSIWGFNPSAFHALYLLIHLLSVLIVYAILKDIIHALKPHFSQKLNIIYSTFVAVIFAVHPLQVEAVAWISASKIILYAFFMLLAIWGYIKYVKSKKVLWFFFVAFMYMLSFGSKEQAIIFPLNLLIIDYIFKRYNSVKLSFKSFMKPVILEKIPFFFLALLFWYFSVQSDLGNIVVDNFYPIEQRLVFGMHSVVEYIFRAIAPVKLYYFYFFPINVGEKLPIYYWAYLFVCFIIICFTWSNYKRNNKIVVVGMLFFIVNLLLVIHIIPMQRKMITADRYMYVSIIGIAFVGICLLHYVYLKYGRFRKLLISIVSLYIVALCVHTHIRTKAWKDSSLMKKNVTELIEKKKLNSDIEFANPLKLNNDE